MDLFSGTFGCFKPAEKRARAELENDQPGEKIKIWVLRCRHTGRVHYLEAYKDFVDILLGFLMLRTGALIRLNHELSPAMKHKTGGIHGVYDSFKRLDDSMVLVDKEILLDPFERLKVSEELQALNNGDFECCNADCFKYLSGSRQICRSCTVSTHFSCIACGGYFRENAHTSLCYTPWRPWRNHMTAAPILTRYTVIQSCPPTGNKQKKEGYVRKDMPFIVTNELVITPLCTTTLSEVLKTCGAVNCQDLECNELSIGTPEVKAFHMTFESRALQAARGLYEARMPVQQRIHRFNQRRCLEVAMLTKEATNVLLQVLVMLAAALTSPTPLTDIFGKMCNEKTRVSSSGSGSSFAQFPPCEKISKSCGLDGSSIKRSRGPPFEKKISKPHNHEDSSGRRLTSSTPSSKSKPSQKKSQSEDDDDSSLRRRTTMTSSALPPCQKTPSSRDRNDSSIQRATSIVKHAIMSQKNSPDPSPCQSPSQSPLRQKVADTPTACTPHRSSLGRESPKRQVPKKISFQQQADAYESPESEHNCAGSVCPPTPPSPGVIAGKSSFIQLPTCGELPQQLRLDDQHRVRRSTCASSTSQSSAPDSQSMEQVASPIRSPLMSSEQVQPQASPSRRPNSICAIDDCALVSSQSSLPQSNSTSIMNPLFKKESSMHHQSGSKSSQPVTLPPLRPPSVIENELLPCIARQSQNAHNLRQGPGIVHRSMVPVKPQPGATNRTRPAVNFCKKSAFTGIGTWKSVGAAFERGSERSCSHSEVGSDSCDSSEYSDAP